ncbi:MAG: S8/S53 family peptidase [Proteobacteria bacterium]|nr:S8/S53 family peptidase [Pseudomonadota bacterium]
MSFNKRVLAAVVAASVCSIAAAEPYPHGKMTAYDLGPVSASDKSDLTVTVALNLRNRDQLEQLVEATYTHGSPSYHKFLTTAQFAAQFGPSAATVAAVTRHFESLGLTVTRSATAQLHLTGSAAQLGRAFGVELHAYEVPATSFAPALHFHAPAGAPQIPAAVAGAVHSVLGLDNRPVFAPHVRRVPVGLPALKPGNDNTPDTPDLPGSWTVQDLAIYYDVNPVYKKGFDGTGQTIGIVTLASFTPSDAFTYWNSLGLGVKKNRITEIQVDGGSGPPSDAAGSDETTLDVQQSGGIAPGAKILVYEAPNTDQGFVDAFAAAIDANKADTVSTSWGAWEFFGSANPNADGPVTNPVTGKQSTVLKAEDDLLTQAAIQGQSMFAASGDNGAFDAADEVPADFSLVLSVDDPSSQRFMTSAGGTTLPGVQKYANNVKVNIKQEQGWGWDYLIPVCASQGFDPVACGIFAGGSGGGVSYLTALPFYQQGIPGMKKTLTGQALVDSSTSPPTTIVKLPGNFAGRNVPDISLNADPQTGYIVPYTSSSDGFITEQLGGTSFVAPQLNGITSLYNQALGHRVGLLNVPAYQLLKSGAAYSGNKPPFRDMSKGDNWFWDARAGYDQVTGIGVPDVANLLKALEDLD